MEENISSDEDKKPQKTKESKEKLLQTAKTSSKGTGKGTEATKGSHGRRGNDKHAHRHGDAKGKKRESRLTDDSSSDTCISFVGLHVS